jgi:hypothetical protein
MIRAGHDMRVSKGPRMITAERKPRQVKGLRQ